MGAEKNVRYWSSGREEVLGLWWRGRHGETQIVPLPNLPGSLRSDPRRVEEVRPSVEAVSETVSNRPTPQSVPLKAVSGCVRNGAPLAREEHRRKKGRRGQDHRQHRHLSWTRKAPNAGRSQWQWNARERVLIKSLENCLTKSEHIQVGDLEHFSLSPEDGAISILSFAEISCDEGGRQKFAVLKTKRGIEVTEIGQFFVFWRPWRASKN